MKSKYEFMVINQKHVFIFDRLQTVSREDEPWYHALLVAIGQKTNGSEILLNTSFNVKVSL